MNSYPIVLVPGIARFDFMLNSFLKKVNLFFWDLSPAFDRAHYFKGVASFLAKNNFDVHKASPPFAADVETRAKDLRRYILRVLEQTNQEKVHIIGHSMGGLDARHMIVDEGMADRVATVTTIGTPHLGTSFADWGLSHGGGEAIKIVSSFLDLEGFLTLTRAARERFNVRARHQEATNSVVYQTYASFEERVNIFAPIQFSWRIIFEEEGDNDGLVSANSQAWTNEIRGDDGTIKQIRQHRFPFPADHLNQVAWWDLEELRRPNWWRLGLMREKRRYEQAVKEIYRQIALDVSRLPL